VEGSRTVNGVPGRPRGSSLMILVGLRRLVLRFLRFWFLLVVLTFRGAAEFQRDVPVHCSTGEERVGCRSNHIR
jgi:hypothetical protein